MGAARVEVTSAEIARLAGVKAAAVSNWRRRHEDFPARVGGTDRSPRFDLEEVERWLKGRRTPLPVDPMRRLQQAFDSVRATVSGDEALGAVGLFLLHLHRNPEKPVPGDRRGLTRLMADAEHEFVTGTGVGPGIEDMAAHRPQGDIGSRQLSLLAAAAEAAGDADPASVFERLCGHAEDTAGPRTQAFPREVAELMLRFAGEPRGTLVDPSCGNGDLLLAAARAGWRRVLGQERGTAGAWVSALRLAFARHDGALRTFDVHAEDALKRPAYALGAADAAVLAPPFGDRGWGLDELEHDHRWVYGVPPRIESELAWVQHGIAQVAPGGTVVVLMPPAAAARRSGRRIRRSLITGGALRAVVSLPPGLATANAVALQIWVLHNPEGVAAPTDAPVLLMDAAAPKPRLQRGLAPETIARVAELWSEYTAQPDVFRDRPGLARTVPPTDLLEADIDVTPQRYLVPSSGRVSADELARSRERFTRLIAEVGEALPHDLDVTLTATSPPRFVTVDELANSGAVFVRRIPPRRGEDTGNPPGSRTVDARVLTVEDVIDGRAASGTEPVDADEVRNPPLRIGEVVVPAVAPHPVARVADESDAGAYPGPNVYVLRTDSQTVDPWFLAGQLSSSFGARQAARIGSSTGRHLRTDPRRLRIPLPPIETQRAHGEVFREGARFLDRLQAALATGHELVQQTFDRAAADLSPDRAADADKAPTPD